MGKVALGPQTILYPMPVVLVGAVVDGKPNFMAAAWCGIASSEPPMISVAIRPHRHTFKGIQQNQTFSINVPSTDLVREIDYCGTISGVKVDKVAACKLTVFYGKLGTAPLVDQFPVNLECKVAHVLDLGSHFLFVGRIEEAYVSGDCLSDGKPDVTKIKPLVFSVGAARQYRGLGEVVEKAFSIGLGLREQESTTKMR